MDPSTLSQVLRHLPKINHPSLLIGSDTCDDAAVYKLDEQTALVQTVDFFTPIVDDPYQFGQIAASNALSDIYAMGAKPLLALNIVCFPTCLDPNILAEILKGGFDTVQKAGAIIAGGHTVQDEEPKYGLAVTGLIHPEQIVSNGKAQIGDFLVLTKPLGTGIINTAIKAEMVSQEAKEAALKNMIALNKEASEAMLKANAKSCTDITGFGLIGHSVEMAKASNLTFKIDSNKIPLLPDVKELCFMGLIPAGSYNNKEHYQNQIDYKNITPEMISILNDPQTSGGLLIAIKKENLEILMKEMKIKKVPATIIGEVIKRTEKDVEVI